MKKGAPGPAGWCDYHEKQVPYSFLRRRGCVVPRWCRHFWWMSPAGEKIKCNPKQPKEKQGRENQCMS